MNYGFFKILFVSAVFLSTPVLAEDDITFEAGLAAYQKGNYLESFYIWKSLAVEGDSLSAYNLGVLYAMGLGVEKDSDRAVALYRQSAEAGYAPAQYNLGMAYLRGEGVSVDYKEAAKWWVRAVEQKNIQAIFNLATLYMKGLGVDKDEDTARKFYKMAADLGDVRSARILEELGTQEPGKSAPASDHAKINNWILQQPEHHYTVQVFAMRDEVRALDYIADRGLVNDIALFRVVIDGEIWHKALYRSFENRQAAIQARDMMARVLPDQSPWLRMFYDVKREIVGWRAHAVPGQSLHKTKQQTLEQGANDELRRGQSAFINQRYSEAYEAWRPLAEQGFAEAQYGLGFMYESGWGLERDYARAYTWYERAAHRGHPKSQYNLGMLYLNGFGVEKDLNKAHYWIKVAASRKDPRAVDYVERLQIKD